MKKNRSPQGNWNTPGLIAVFMVLVLLGTQSYSAFSSPVRELGEEQLAPVAVIVDKSIREGKIPGAVVLIGNSERVLYRRSFGYRAVDPEKIPMTEDTIFDLASLTKVVATTIAVMQLVENGKLRLGDTVSKYWPEFKAKGKGSITLRHLLTHYSGLRPGLEIAHLAPGRQGYETVMEKIIEEKPLHPPGRVYIYSDINFEILGELVRRVSGQPLDEYCARHIFEPLGMRDTVFNPSSSIRCRIAPTAFVDGKLLHGEVHDPACSVMGGVSGHAGLFSTADDLSIFARMLLNRGSLGGVKILNPRSVERMTTPQIPQKTKLRGLGWDIEAPFCANREAFSAGAYGHLGYTGTAIWIDPVSDTYIIVLTNRVHPDGKGDVKELRAGIKSVVSQALGPVSCGQILSKLPSLSGYCRDRTYVSKRIHTNRSGS